MCFWTSYSRLFLWFTQICTMMTSYRKNDYFLDLQTQIFGFFGKFYIKNDPTLFRQTWNMIHIDLPCLFSTITLHFASLASATSSKTSLKPLVCLQFRAAKPRKNRLNSNACSFVKSLYYWRVFLFASLWCPLSI